MVTFTADAGHGYNTAGKRTPDGEREWSFNNKALLAYQKELLTYKDVNFVRLDDPTGKTDVSLENRVKKMVSVDSVLNVSFHQNALNSVWGNHTGTETFVCKNPTNQELAIAKNIQLANVKAYGLRDRGVKTADYYILKYAVKNKKKIPSVLIEGGFMDSRIDISKLRDDKVLELAGKLTAQAVAYNFRLTKKGANTQPPVEKPVEKPNNNTSATGTIKVLVDNLNYYNGPRWKNPTGTVKKNTVFTTVDKIKVDGAWQYKLKSGTYITASDKYVKFTAK